MGEHPRYVRMYIGRYLVVGPRVGAYRVSSRSFPNRQIVERGDALTVVPTEAAESTDNPYVSYNCLRTVGAGRRRVAVFGNGSHVDPIVEKIELGYPARDAIALGLLALDYEKDDYDTPRIVASIDTEQAAVVGTVRQDGLEVRAVDEPTLVATYERDSPVAVDFDAVTAESAARSVMEQSYDHAVCAAGVAVEQDGFEMAITNGQS